MAKKDKRKSRVSTSTQSMSIITLPRELRPALLDGEDRATYNHVLAEVAAAIQPRDIIEQLWVRDIADLAWDGLRLRRLKVGLLNASLAEGLEEVLRPLVGPAEAIELASSWDFQKRSAIKRVGELLAKAAKTMIAVRAQTLAKMLDKIERIDRMIANVELRRHAALRELDRRRGALTPRLPPARVSLDNSDSVELPPG